MVQNLFSLFFGPLSTVSGIVSSLRETTRVSGSVDYGRGRIRSSTQTNFRIGKQPATMWSIVAVVDTDLVTAAGTETGGTFAVLAIRNETTGYVYTQPHSVLLSWVAVAISISLMPILIGFILLPIAAMGVWHSRRVIMAAALLQQTQLIPIATGDGEPAV